MCCLVGQAQTRRRNSVSDGHGRGSGVSDRVRDTARTSPAGHHAPLAHLPIVPLPCTQVYLVFADNIGPACGFNGTLDTSTLDHGRSHCHANPGPRQLTSSRYCRSRNCSCRILPRRHKEIQLTSRTIPRAACRGGRFGCISRDPSRLIGVNDRIG